MYNQNADLCYISTTSKFIASHVVQYYNLKKIMSEHKFEMFEGTFQLRFIDKKIYNKNTHNKHILMIVTPKDIYGIPTCAGYLFAKYPPNENSYFLNVDPLIKYSLNNFHKPILCNKIVDQVTSQDYYTDILYKHNFQEGAIFCGIDDNKKANNLNCCMANDMSAAAIYKAVSHFLTLDKIFIIRIPDYEICSKGNDNNTQSQILHASIISVLDWFNNLITSQQPFINNCVDDEIKNCINVFETIISNLKFSENMKQQILKIFTYRALRDFEICQNIIKEYKNKKSMSKQEAKKYFESIKHALMDF